MVFTAKTGLINYYRDVLGAKQIGNSLRMYIDEVVAQMLIDKYMRQ